MSVFRERSKTLPIFGVGVGAGVRVGVGVGVGVGEMV